MALEDLRIIRNPDGKDRRLHCKGITIRLLSDEQIQALSDHNFSRFRAKFIKLKVVVNMDPNWEDCLPREEDGDAFRAFDFLRHAINRRHGGRNV